MKQIILAAVAVVATTNSTLAHSKAEKTAPANEATLETADVTDVRFDDPMRVTAITLAGPDGDLAIERETGTKFRALLPSEMPAGTYSVNWSGLSADGYPIRGTFGFTVTD